jgi:D-glycero-alpha-D-manno-heptose-7-phosphate kinase
MIISKTPLRISFAGGGTDLRSYYKYNKYGAVLSTSIDKYLYVVIKKQNELFKEKFRLNYSETEITNNVNEIKNPIIREALKYLNIDDQLYISTISDIPASTGLGSSSTFCVGLLNALYKFKGESVSVGRLAEEAAHIECDILKRPMGKQDHYAAAYGGINYIRFYDDESVTIRPVGLSKTNLESFLSSILIFWTSIKRPSESILKEQDEKNGKNFDTLSLMKNQALELSKILKSSSLSIKEIGEMLNEGWELKKTLASNISNSNINEWYQTAISNGAYGGKISGAGGGGFFTFIADLSKHEAIIKQMASLGINRYVCGFDSNGTVTLL